MQRNMSPLGYNSVIDLPEVLFFIGVLEGRAIEEGKHVKNAKVGNGSIRQNSGQFPSSGLTNPSAPPLPPRKSVGKSYSQETLQHFFLGGGAGV